MVDLSTASIILKDREKSAEPNKDKALGINRKSGGENVPTELNKRVNLEKVKQEGNDAGIKEFERKMTANEKYSLLRLFTSEKGFKTFPKGILKEKEKSKYWEAEHRTRLRNYCCLGQKQEEEEECTLVR